MKPSKEQKEILKAIKENHSVIGDCVAGSGKTTTIFFIAKMFPNKNILQITYNAQLKLEVREKVEQSNINNLEIHTYHSLAVKYYHENGHDDNVINNIIKNDVVTKRNIPKYDIVVIDETQDMTLLFYKLIHKFLNDHNNTIQMLVLGDKHQGVYKFKGADFRYLTLSENLWNKSLTFQHKTLNISYRLTNQTSAFVNNVMLGEERIQTIRQGLPVTYLYGNMFHMVTHQLFKYICKILESGQITPDDIFILAPSIKKKGDTNHNKKGLNPLKLLENKLASKGIPVCYPISDDAMLDENIIKGKVVFSTFHQSKGRERKIVVLFNFDSSYFKYFDKVSNPNVCPSVLYVAATRSITQLIVLHGSNNTVLPFFKKSLSELKTLDYIHFIDLDDDFKKKDASDELIDECHITSPTELVGFIKDIYISELSTIVGKLFHQVQAPYYSTKIPSKVLFENGLCEDVSDINGLVIPALYEEKHVGNSTIQRKSESMYKCMLGNKKHTFLKKSYEHLETIEDDLEYYTYLGIMYISLQEELYHKIYQMPTYTWLSQEMIQGCFKSLEKNLSAKYTTYEVQVSYECDYYIEYGPIKVCGRIDALDKSTAFELKCVESLCLEHYLQVIIYAWMWKYDYASCEGPRDFEILNMKSGELHVLDTTSPLIDTVMGLLFENKYADQKHLSDKEFIENCLSTRKDIDFIYKNSNDCMIVDE
jgi:nucleoside-triphosphatase THEP1